MIKINSITLLREQILK